ITHAFSWHWLFLINVVPGVISAAAGAVLLPRSPPSWREAKSLDFVALALLAGTLAALEIALKESPSLGWASPFVLGLFGLSAIGAAGFTIRVLRRDRPIVNLRALSDPRFAVACCLSFVLGIGLFGSVYMMPVFLALVRGHEALAIGQIMLVTGLAQLVAAPVAVFLEKRMDARILAAAGFLLFAIGLAMSAHETPATDFAEMFWPQIVRGAAVMFCLLPPTRLALGHLPLEKIPDASGLFNLMRNLGGAIGIALVDTVIFGRAPLHAAAIADQLRSGNIDTAIAAGIPVQAYLAARDAPISAAAEALARPLVERLALSEAINDAWLLIAAITAAATLSLLFIARVRTQFVAASTTL
ncbi:MAG: MFS transporter, partial [Methyloceanibacter sp.]|nr:MFS transporter [Methyloceanibacter sp.]